MEHVLLLIICITLSACGPIARRAAVNDRLQETQAKARIAYQKALSESKTFKGCKLGVQIHPKTLALLDVGSKARASGLLAGDRIVAVNGVIVSTNIQLKGTMKSLDFNLPVRLTVLRDAGRIEVNCSCLSPSELLVPLAEAFKDASNANWQEAYSKVKTLRAATAANSKLKAIEADLYLMNLLSKGINPDNDTTMPYLVYERSLLQIQEESYSIEALQKIHPGIVRDCNILEKHHYGQLATEIQESYETALHEASLPATPLPTPTSSAPAEQKDSLSAIVKEVSPSVVTVLSYGRDGSIRQGSGFFVNRDGLLITNAHVVENAASVELKLSSGNDCDVRKILFEDAPGDLVLLSADIPNGSVHGLSIADDVPEPGERVLVIGSPRGLEQSVSDGIVSAIRELPAVGKIYQISAPISPGSSGSPVVNLKGQVIGVATMQMLKGQNLNFAISIDRLKAWQ